MTTQALRDAMSLVDDPTEMQWFDVSSMIGDQTNADVEPLMTYRPPFERCFVVSRGPSRNHAIYDIMMMVTGTDPVEGITVAMWKGPYGQRPRTLPLMVYLVDGDMLRYGPVEEGEEIEKGTATLMLAIVGQWYKALAAGTTVYQPYVKQSFTNRRKAAEGKAPRYDWRTIIIKPRLNGLTCGRR